MSLRTEFLSDLNALAKSKDVEGLVSKMREVMVNRHPATLSAEEQDPVETVALAWKEVAARGKPSFEEAALSVVSTMETARVTACTDKADWPLVRSILRLLAMLPWDQTPSAYKDNIARLLSGAVSERHDLLAMVQPGYPDASLLWSDAFRLYLVWHPRQPALLEVMWERSLSDEGWPVNDGAAVFMEDAALRHPDFVTFERLVRFWRGALFRSEATEDLKRWFYIVGASLEESPAGRGVLVGLHDQFGGHLQDHRHDSPRLPWDHFVEVVAAMFRNPARQQHIRSFKAASKAAATVLEHHNAIPQGFKGTPESVSRDLLSSLLNPRATA